MMCIGISKFSLREWSLFMTEVGTEDKMVGVTEKDKLC